MRPLGERARVRGKVAGAPRANVPGFPPSRNDEVLLILPCAFDVLCAVAFDGSPPFVCAEHHSLVGLRLARVFAPARQGCRSRFIQARDGLYKTPDAGEKRRAAVHRSFTADERPQRPGRPFFVTFCGC